MHAVTSCVELSLNLTSLTVALTVEVLTHVQFVLATVQRQT